MAQMVKNLPAIKETWVQSLGQEDPLEKGMATHFSILAWRIPWTEEPGGYDGELRETLFRRQGSQVSMRMAMGSGSLPLPMHPFL